MLTNTTFRSLTILALAFLLTTSTSFGQAQKKMYSEVYYHKIKPGHTFAEARAFENEFKKVHQVQADEGFLLGWYMLALEMTTNPNREYDYVTIKNVSDPGYFDNSYPETALKKGWGDEYQKKMIEVIKQGREVTETAKVEIWENLDLVVANPLPTPDKSPVWAIRFIRAKDNQQEAFINLMKKGRPFTQAMLDAGGGTAMSFSRLLYPSASEKPYEFAALIQLQKMKILFDDFQEEAVFKKTMPGMDPQQYDQQLTSLRDRVREEFYYLMEYAVKAPSTQVKN